MSRFIDRRSSDKHKNVVNRQRFIRRHKLQIQHAIQEAITKRSIRNIEDGEAITLPSKDLDEKTFGYGEGGLIEQVLPGNQEFVKGDRLPKHKHDEKSQTSHASDRGEGQDEFVFEITREEFMELYFDDLALPDLVRKQVACISDDKFKRAGVTTSGVPANINVVRSMRQATGRRVATKAGAKKLLHEEQANLAKLLELYSANDPSVIDCRYRIQKLQQQIDKVPFIDAIDLRYNNLIKQHSPTTQAVMFCVMDVSGSMDEAKKDIAKRFFILLYLFLERNYKKIDLVFIRHHTSAKEVEEQEFFYSRETGGTVVSSALELMRDIIATRYPINDWNIYVAQASDGDNWNADSPYCQKLLLQHIMPYIQYYAYVEIMPRHHQSLWDAYVGVHERFANFVMQNIENISEIYPVFRELFKRHSPS